jgi:hypothetical protein
MKEYTRGSKVEISFYVMAGFIFGFASAMLLAMGTINHLVGMLIK